MKVSGYNVAPVGPTFKATASKSVWSPGQILHQAEARKKTSETEEMSEVSPVWQPFGGPADAPQFRTVRIEMKATREPESKTLESRGLPLSDKIVEIQEEKIVEVQEEKIVEVQEEKIIPQNVHEHVSHKSPEDAVQTPIPRSSSSTDATFRKSLINTSLPPSQSPTVTLLQKAREGVFPRGAVYIDTNITSDGISDGPVVRTEEYYALKANPVTLTTVTDTKALKYDGIGPTEYGIPTGLRTSVKEENASDWYRTMYRSLHRQPLKKGQTVDYGGYMSEPEFSRNSSGSLHKSKRNVSSLQRKPIKQPDQELQILAKEPELSEADSNPFLPSSNRPFYDTYRNQPRSIADYEPGHSSIADKEFQKFWGDFWDSLDDMKFHFGDDIKQNRYVGRRWPNCDGYDSDSTIIRKTGETRQLDPVLQKVWYKEVQKGGEIPFTGLGKPAPEKPKNPPHQYQETEVNIHYRSPIRNLEKEYIEEEELRRRQEIAMKKFYEEEKYKKKLQHQAEIEMRRHCDFFTPSQKSPIPLNRYDNPFTNKGSSASKTPEPRTLTKALFPFTAHTTRELSFNKGDIVYINKKIDKNWYEGEHHGQIGIFPVNYVEIIPFEDANLQPRKATEGQAIVKYNFRAQTPLELSLFKGEAVVLIRKIDNNWHEGRIGTKRGIFPSSYVEITTEPMEISGCNVVSPKSSSSPVHGVFSSNNDTYLKRPQSPMLSEKINPLSHNTFNFNPSEFNKIDEKKPITQSLRIDTYNEPIPYRSLYGYCPQNEDELQLWEGDTIYVMEKCDDGWYVGTSLRSGLFGTFPGNYVERI